MELIRNSVCSICSEDTSVLSNSAVQPYFKQLENAFFEDSNNFIQFQEQIGNKSFCALCVEKIVIANLFKSAYEDITKKRGSFQNTYERCFFCEGENGDLLRVNDNPNDFVTKIAVFMKYTSYPSSCESCATCFECFLHANIWFEIYNKIHKRRKPNRKEMKQLDAINHNNSSLGNDVLQKDKENVTPPHNNIQKVKRKSQRRLRPLSKQKSDPVRRKTRNEHGDYKKSKSFQDLLKKQLKKFKSLKAESHIENNWSSSISSDSKMYNQIPYVLMVHQELQPTYRATRKKSKENAMEVIVLSDSDGNSGVKQAPKLLIRRPIKISLSKNFTLDTSKKKKGKGRVKRVIHTCHVCDKEFNNFCNYKTHTLWHEKPEHFQINVIRHNLPAQINASDFPIRAVSTNGSGEEANVTKNLEKEETSLAKDVNESHSMSETCDTSQENALSNNTDSTRKENSDSESANDGSHEINHSESNTTNEEDHAEVEKNKLPEETHTEPEINGVIEHQGNETLSESIHIAAPQAHSTMFDSDENVPNDIDKSLSTICGNDKSEDEAASGDNENGEVNNYDKHTRKRKWDDLSGNLDQNSGDETAPKRKKVRFALDYTNSTDAASVNEDLVNSSDGLNENDSTIVNEI